MTSFKSIISTKDGSFYKVIMQHENEYRRGCIDVFAKRVEDKHYVRIIGYDPFDRTYDAYNDFGNINKQKLKEKKLDFFYKRYLN